MKTTKKRDHLSELTEQVAALGAIEFRPMLAAEMPFSGPDGLWSVAPPEGYGESWMWGERMALYALLYQGHAECDAPPIAVYLRSIALRQVERGEATDGDKGAILGFWSVVGTLLAGVVFPGGVEILAARLKRRYEWYAKQEEKRVRAISRRCRRAALIGAAKRKAAQRTGRRAAA